MIGRAHVFKKVTFICMVALLCSLLGGYPPQKVSASELLPQISYVTKSADLGVPMLIMGENVDKATEVWVWFPGHNSVEEIKSAGLDQLPPLPATPPKGAQKAKIISQPNSHTIIVQHAGENPFVFSRYEPAVAWLKAESGFSEPYVFNQPELYFASHTKVLPGEKLRLFGRDLTYLETPLDFPIMFRDIASKKVYWGDALNTTNQARPNKYQFTLEMKVPNDIVPGTYEIFMHNLSGGPWSWSNGIKVEAVNSLDPVSMITRPGEHNVISLDAQTHDEPEMKYVHIPQSDGPTDKTKAINRRSTISPKKQAALLSFLQAD